MTSDKIKFIRSRNLQAIVEKVGKGTEVARIIDCDPVYISQILNGHRVCGMRFAERVEKAFDMREGSLSIDPTVQSDGERDVQTYRTAIETVLALKPDQIQAIMPVLQTLRNISP